MSKILESLRVLVHSPTAAVLRKKNWEVEVGYLFPGGL
jgi:hypothetical protein